MPLNKETKPNQTNPIKYDYRFLLTSQNMYDNELFIKITKSFACQMKTCGSKAESHINVFITHKKNRYFLNTFW